MIRLGICKNWAIRMLRRQKMKAHPANDVQFYFESASTPINFVATFPFRFFYVRCSCFHYRPDFHTTLAIRKRYSFAFSQFNVYISFRVFNCSTSFHVAQSIRCLQPLNLSVYVILLRGFWRTTILLVSLGHLTIGQHREQSNKHKGDVRKTVLLQMKCYARATNVIVKFCQENCALHFGAWMDGDKCDFK